MRSHIFAQLERDLIKARTTEGREEAKAKGKHMGRLPALSDKQAKELYKDKLNGESISALAKKYSVSRPTVHRTIERMGKQGTKNMAIVTPAFVSDCLETLEEIDIRGRETFFNAGGKNMTYIPCLNDSEDTINLLENLVRAS